MIDKINDPGYVQQIGKNQTGKLIRKYERSGNCDAAVLRAVKRVALMTPEDELITTTRGEHSPGGNNPLDPNYRYRVASVTKSFTATLILRLAEEGYFELDDKLFEYLEIPGLDNGIAITIEHLLTHTSGMGDHLNDGGFYTGSDWQTRVWEHQDIYDYTVDQGSFFWPGSSYRYSNTGFYVLGALAEAVTGQSLSDLYKSYIFNPLAVKGATGSPGNALAAY